MIPFLTNPDDGSLPQPIMRIKPAYWREDAYRAAIIRYSSRDEIAHKLRQFTKAIKNETPNSDLRSSGA